MGDIVEISHGTGLDGSAAQGGQVEITALANGAVTTATIVNPSTGYAVNDLVSVPGGNYGRFQVASLVPAHAKGRMRRFMTKNVTGDNASSKPRPGQGGVMHSLGPAINA